MSTYAVTMMHPNAGVLNAVAREYPNRFYKWTETVVFVSANETALEVAEKIGVPKRGTTLDESSVRDILVMKIAPSYWGFASAELWDWLKESLERDG